MFRPQFPYPPATSPCEDQTCQYSFDSTNLPALSGTLTAGNRTGRIPLKLDRDADFLLRAIKTQGSFSFRLEDPNGNPLSDSENATNSSNYEFPRKGGNTAGAGMVALESAEGGIFAPSGGNFLLYLYNAGTTTLNFNTFAMNLIGVKRYQGVCQ